MTQRSFRLRSDAPRLLRGMRQNELRSAKTAGERREVEANSLDSLVRRRCGLEREGWTDKETLQEGQ